MHRYGDMEPQSYGGHDLDLLGSRDVIDHAHKSCIMNKQYGFGNSKYVVILDPLPTGHVTRGMRSEILAFNMGNCNF